MLLELENVTFNKPTLILMIGEHDISENFFRVYRLIYDIKIFQSIDLFFDSINEQLPDAMIISVIPSDRINGLMILNSLISNTKFNSVPIISLIEDESEDYIQLVLEKGATDYVTKKMLFNLIRHKINALIRIKNNLLNKINQYEVELKNDFVAEYNDREFLSKFINEINDIIENDKNSSIKEIAKNLHVSLNFLEKKVKLAFGKCPRRYILDKRLEKADLLLKTKKASIKNIAFETGFNSTAYFTKCFRLKYGKTPKSSKIQIK